MQKREEYTIIKTDRRESVTEKSKVTYTYKPVTERTEHRMNVSKARNSKKYSSPAAEKGRAAAGKVAVSFGRMLATVLLVCVLAGCICVCVMISYIMSFANSRLDIPLEKLKQDYTSAVYAYNEELGDYEVVEYLYSDENRIWAEFEEIPDHVFDAFVAVEDQRFEQHDGVDWKRTILSFVNLVIPIYEGKPGGSTITQQLIKNITGDDDVRIDRKIREIMMAMNLEKDYDKDEILLAYVNRIYLGAHSYGVQVAANTYFDKDVSELTIAEAACLAGIVQNPTKRNPFINPEDNRVRQEYALEKMLELGYITQAEYDEAMAQEMVFAEEKYTTELASRQSFFVDEVRRQVVKDLCEDKGWDETYAQNQLLTGGYHIYTTVDAKVQKVMDEVYADPATFEDFEGDEEQPQSAMIIMESDGRVVGIVGARGEKNYDMSLNYATMTVRQPGSSIKPLAVYSVGIEENLFTYSTMMDDHDLKKDENWTMYGEWMPKNNYSRFQGMIPICEAVSRSCNTIAAQVTVDYNTPELAFQYATEKYHLSTLVESRRVNGRNFTDRAAAPMTLGALTDGAVLEEMTAAYQAFTNGGYYNEPYYYTEVKDADGNTVLQHSSDSERIISEDTSYIMSKILEYTVTFKNGTCRKLKLTDMTSCGKSGSTNDNKDKWAIGFTPYYIGGVWTGYESYSTTYEMPTNTSIEIWQKVMEKLHQELGLEDKPVQNQPSSVVTRYFCTKTGLVGGPNCPDTQIGYYRKSNIPATCTHTFELLDPDDLVSSEGVSDVVSAAVTGDVTVAAAGQTGDMSAENVTAVPTATAALDTVQTVTRRKKAA